MIRLEMRHQALPRHTAGNATSNIATTYRYTGREYDADTGLYYYRNRWYDPEVGRFISEDPIGFAGDDVNLYGYVGNNPLSFVDPFGFWRCPFEEPSLGWLDGVQLALGTAGMVPGFGEVFDLADAGISYLRGDYLGASLSMAAAIPGIGNVAGAGKLANRLNKVAKGLAPAKRASNKTVLGGYPDYIELSDKLGARRFDVPIEIWKNKMTPAQRWDANRKFLDRMISKGDEVILSNPASSAKPDTSFFREIEYLKS